MIKTSIAIAVSLVVTAAANSHAAVITWNSPVTVNYSTPTQVSTTGTFVNSFAFVAGNPQVNGVTFNSFTGNSGPVASFGGNITVNLGTNGTPNFAASGPSASTSSAYGTLLSKSGAVYQPANAQISLTGLTSGFTYQIQLWQAPWGGLPAIYSSSADFSLGVSGAVTSGTTTFVDVGGVVKWVPDYVVGMFVADGTSQSIYFRSGETPANFVVGPAAGQLRLTAVPEPAVWGLVIGSLTFLVVKRRRRVL